MPKTNKKAETIVQIGEPFSDWTVIGLGSKIDYVKCKCKCGQLKEVNVYSLTSGKSRSCGCRKKTKKLLAIVGPI